MIIFAYVFGGASAVEISVCGGKRGEAMASCLANKSEVFMQNVLL